MTLPNARRKFLSMAGQSLAGALLGPQLLNMVMGQLLEKALADGVGATPPPGNLLHISLPGGPPRWMFDLPLTPNGLTSANFRPGFFGTRYAPNGVGGALKPVYSVDRFTVNGRDVYLAPVWGMGTAHQRFTDLLPNTVFIRGMDNQINSHLLSNRMQVAPVVGGLSTTGVVADLSSRPMPSIVDGLVPASDAFRSTKGYAVSPINYAVSGTVNPVKSLLSPFADFRGTRPMHSADQTALQDQALSQFEDMALRTNMASNALPKMYENAMDLLDKNVLALGDRWETTLAKYQAIISEAIRPTKGTLPGFFDVRIPGAPAGTVGGPFSYGISGQTVALSDLRDMTDATTSIPRMAENFTIAEILLDSLTSSMTLGFLPQMRLLSGNSDTYWNAVHDQHFIGAMVSTLQTTLFYRALLACLTEYVRVLKSSGAFDRTVIHIASEFNRAPRANGSGSDHGYMASNATLISGKIGRMGVVGNIQVGDLNSTYTGTFGVANGYVLDGLSRPIQQNDVALTITSMFAAETVVTNGRSLLGPSSAGWVLRREEALNNG